MLTVLVADDEFAVLEVLAMALEGEGHRVLKAGHGADALRVLASQACDVVLVDEFMPVMNAHQMLEVMQADPRLANVPVILMAESWGKQLPSVPGALVVGKPLRLAELLETVERLGNPRRQP
jgi:CheY-like chemotaxis protein